MGTHCISTTRSAQQQGQRQTAQKQIREAAAFQKGSENPAVGLVNTTVLQDKRCRRPFGLPPQHMIGGPGGDGEGYQQGHDHGQRHIEGHGPHVGPHHAGDEKQGQEGDNNRKGGQNRGRPDLVHCG